MWELQMSEGSLNTYWTRHKPHWYSWSENLWNWLEECPVVGPGRVTNPFRQASSCLLPVEMRMHFLRIWASSAAVMNPAVGWRRILAIIHRRNCEEKLTHSFFPASLIFSTLISEKPLILRSRLVVQEIKLWRQISIEESPENEKLTATVWIFAPLSLAISLAPMPVIVSGGLDARDQCCIPCAWISSMSTMPLYFPSISTEYLRVAESPLVRHRRHRQMLQQRMQMMFWPLWSCGWNIWCEEWVPKNWKISGRWASYTLVGTGSIRRVEVVGDIFVGKTRWGKAEKWTENIEGRKREEQNGEKELVGEWEEKRFSPF